MEGENGNPFDDLKPNLLPSSKRLQPAPEFLHLNIFQSINTNAIHSDKKLGLCLNYDELIAERKKIQEDSKIKSNEGKKKKLDASSKIPEEPVGVLHRAKSNEIPKKELEKEKTNKMVTRSQTKAAENNKKKK